MVFGWVRKLFRKKKSRNSSVKQPVALVRAHTFHTSNVPPSLVSHFEQSDPASPVSSRDSMKRLRRSLRRRVVPQAARVHDPDSSPERVPYADNGNQSARAHPVHRRETIASESCRGPRVVHTPSRIATLTKRDYQRIFNHQFDVSKIPEVKVPSWKTSRPYEQQAAHFKFRMSGRFYESDASTIHGGPPTTSGYDSSKPTLQGSRDSAAIRSLGQIRQSDVCFDDSHSFFGVVEEGDLPSSPEVSTFSL